MTLTITEVSSMTCKIPVQIMKKYIDDGYCLELLRFFGTYPNAKFGELAVIHALNDNGEKSRIRSALGRLIIDGAILTCIENGTHLYQLTDDISMHDSVINLARIDWQQWHKMLKHI
jgi:hypothetical protein